LTIQADFIISGVSSLDRRLKSAAYFSVEEYPVIAFKSTGFHKIDETKFTVTGELTIRGITKTVEVTTVLHHKGRHKMVTACPTVYNGQWVGIKASANILRSDFDMKAFVPMISDQIRVEVNLELQMKNQ
jgi:polyisoprenoid-binding protein YceI